MSRIGRKPVPVASGVKVNIQGETVNVEGPLGKLSQRFTRDVALKVDGDKVVVTRDGDTPRERAMHGLARALVQNMIIGVTKGYTKGLEVHGVGYTAKLAGQTITLNVGYANSIAMPVPAGLKVTVAPNAKDKNVTDITISGPDKQMVGQFAATLRRTRPPEPYKQKGIRYKDEVVMKKQGKALTSK